MGRVSGMLCDAPVQGDCLQKADSVGSRVDGGSVMDKEHSHDPGDPLVLQSTESALLTELPQGRSLFSEEGAERPLDILGRSTGGEVFHDIRRAVAEVLLTQIHSSCFRRRPPLSFQNPLRDSQSREQTTPTFPLHVYRAARLWFCLHRITHESE